MLNVKYKNCDRCEGEVYPETWEWNSRLCDPCHTMAKSKGESFPLSDKPIEGVGWTTGTCKQCKKEYQVITLKGAPVTTGYCIPCGEDRIRGKKNSTMEKRMARWNELCPERYRETTTEWINEESFNKVFNWKLSKRGIMCVGNSELGKTTSCWKLLEKLFIFGQNKFEAMTEPEFSQYCASHSSNRSLKPWLDQLCNVPVFFIDDIGHSSTTARHLEDLYYVIEKRTSWNKPIIATTQFNSTELNEKARGSKTTLAILNRLRSNCDIIIF